jgi:uncharacterized heparinase superfamily protein
MSFSPGLYLHTIRHLKPVQIYGRLIFHCYRPRPDLRPAPPLRPLTGKWVPPARRLPTLAGPEAFRLLGRTAELSHVGWDGPPMERLWRYNQHYFEDLNAIDAEDRASWHRALLSRWVRENPPGKGVGWEPYPTSLRVVNWIKWALGGRALSPECLHSVAVQARWLMRRLEFHLLGNHLLAEAKALVFAGLFFQGGEARSWMLKGLRILRRELAEQILPDGGHFERSPMYHAIVLEDLLDLCNLFQAFDADAARRDMVVDSLRRASLLMRQWLSAMCHPDGEIAFFNDAAMGVAASPMELEGYARRLGLPAVGSSREGIVHLEESGYLRCSGDGAVAILDVAPLGPDYLPGHAHADTLSFELSVAAQRVLVNSGTSCYGCSQERLRQRGTASHNTVVVDDLDSSEVWSGFRVARRARPTGLRVDVLPVGPRISCGHDGYRRLRGRPFHERTWTFARGGLGVEDRIRGDHRKAEARFHWHPDCALEVEDGGRRGRARLGGEGKVLWEVERGRPEVVAATYHPMFGESRANRCLVVALEGGESSVRFSWQ